MQEIKTVNVEEIMKQIRAEIAEKGLQDDAIEFEELIGIDSMEGPQGFNRKRLNENVTYLNEYWEVLAYRELYVSSGLKGKVFVFVKKVIRKLTKFYVEPIVNDQNQYNASVTRCMNEMKRFIRETQQENQELKKRIEELEKGR